MNSGIARDIRLKYPRAYEDYNRFHREYGLTLGGIIPTEYPDRTILNIISQEYYGRSPGVRYVSYDAIEVAIRRIGQMGYTRVGFPLIGAGLANGNWNIISTIISETSDFTPVIYYIDEGLKAKFNGQETQS